MKNRLLSLILIITIIVYGIVGYHFLTGWPPLVMMVIAIVIGLGITLFTYAALNFIAKRFKNMPVTTLTALGSGIVVLVAIKLFGFGWPPSLYYPVGGLLLLCASGAAWFLHKRSIGSGLLMGATAIGIGVLLYLLTNPGNDPYEKELPTAFAENSNFLAKEDFIKNPAAIGPFNVNTFTYGNGTDANRTEYSEGVKFRTETVNAEILIPEWKGKKKKWREQYWEFGAKNFPLNGRVYMPEGKGPFPLTLIVHGNHSMIDYSDDGYGYLGNLLASNGIIAVSVDENFLNGHWSGDFRGKEMPARAWLLLKHLEVWNDWNADPDHELVQKVDMDNIMLVGHSRGGEAVSIAAAFNELPYFPDNANEKFDFNFKIKGVVTLAPTDYRYDRKINLKNVNYLSLQGSYDADEVSFWGMRPYRRLTFTDSLTHFKAGVYIHHANHGQFNSTWGKSDFGAPMKWLLNLEPLLTEEQQQSTAMVFVSAFAEATLKNNPGFLPVFKNVSVAKPYLPIEHYLTHFKTASTKVIADFEEDIDITTSGDSTLLFAKNFKLWREENLKTRDKGSQDNNALVLGWDVDTTLNKTPVYQIQLGQNQPLFDSTTTLNLSIASGPLNWLKVVDTVLNKESKKAKREVPQLDFTIQLTDSLGITSKIKVSAIKSISKPLKTRFTKFKFLESDVVGADWEVQLQSFHFPIKMFQTQNLNFNTAQISKIEFLFDQNPYGVVVIDDISVSR